MLTELVGRLPRSWITTANKLRWRSRILNRVVISAAGLLRNRDTVIQRGVGSGLRFNVGNSHSGSVLGTHEPEVQHVFETMVQPGMVFYDLGANVGFYSIIAARLVGPDGHVISFEPLSENAKSILHNASLNGFKNIEVRETAVGAHDGFAKFSLSSFSTFGKFAALGEPDGYTGDTSVPVRRLDSLISSDLPKPDFVKMDVEGGEVDILKGAEKMLQDSRPLLLIELHGTNEAVAAILEKQNYRIQVLGTEQEIREAHWNSHIVATPLEKLTKPS